MKKRATLLLMTLLLAPSLDAEEIKEKTISGTVTSLDWVGSTLTIHYYPAFSIDADEISVKVTSDTIITRGSHSISFSDILQPDPVTVTYYDDGVSGLKAKRVTDLNNAAG